MKNIVSFALTTILFAQAASADSKQETAQGLLRRAAEVSGPAAAMKGPYRIEYKVTFYGPNTEPVQGTYLRTWISRRQWRTEVSTIGYSGTEVEDGESRWVARKPHFFEPHAVSQLLDDLQPVTDAQINPNEKVSKIREDTHGGARLRCIETQSQNVTPSMSEKALCFDESTGALVRIKDNGHRTEFFDFDKKDGALIARKIQQFRGHELVAEAELTSLSPQDKNAAGVLEHPANSRHFTTCDGRVTSGRLVERATPVYPAAARAAHQTGSVEIHAVIDIDGTLKDMEIVKGGSKLLEDSALDAARKWRYEPYMCGGVPVEVETTMSINFSL
jgi:TonB family protein